MLLSVALLLCLCVAAIAFIVGAWSQVQFQQQRLPGTDPITLERTHGMSIGMVLWLRSDLLTERGRVHRKRALIALATFLCMLVSIAILSSVRG